MRKIAIIIVVLLTSYLSMSCKIENITNRPTCLKVVFQEVPSEVDRVNLVFEYMDGFTFVDTVSRQYFDNYEISIRKGRFYLAAFGNMDKMKYDQGYTVPLGCEADRLYVDFKELYCDGDYNCDSIYLKKGFVNLKVRVMGCAEEFDEVFLYVSSSAVGYDLHGNIKIGKYEHRPSVMKEPEADTPYYEFSSRIVRQSEEDVNIELYVRKNNHDRIIKTVNLSDIISEQKLDLQEAEDIFVLIDLAESTIALSIEEWEDMDYSEIEM